jgi:hypothetical protein
MRLVEYAEIRTGAQAVTEERIDKPQDHEGQAESIQT